MSGFGERFRKAGYTLPKPLISVEERPIIAHVIELFPNETDFVFICNQEHLNNPKWQMETILKKYCPTGQIAGISPHKHGPVYAIQQAKHLVNSERPIIVNYCDFSCYWDWKHFKNFIFESKCVGAIPAYRGFHPHSLGKTNYAYMIESNGFVQDIQEKKPYTNNRMEEFASSGTYYFSSGKIMLEAFKYLIDRNLTVSGEYYVSLAYKFLLSKNLPVAVYPIEYFMQWGTPEDLEEYNRWSKTFRYLISKNRDSKPLAGATIIPMAGLGKRFVDEGYSTVKPLIPICKKPMVIHAISTLPQTEKQVFILRKDMPEYDKIIYEIKMHYPNAIIEMTSKLTEGQACTALLGLAALEKQAGHNIRPITFGACDNGIIYNSEKFTQLLKSSQADVIVWGTRGHINAIRSPQMFGWIEEKEGIISYISVKKPLKFPERDPIVIGAFTFLKANHYRLCLEKLISRNGKINGEFYIDTCINDAINLGLRCHLFEVDSFISWGTPNELKTFEYWQSCFNKWNSHPYCKTLDKYII